jgi:RNA polymerase sigma-70 factor (ECF subfamily)
MVRLRIGPDIRDGSGDEVQIALSRVSDPAAATLPRAEVAAMSAGPVEAAGRLGAPRSQAERRVGARRLDPACLGDHIDRLYRAARGMCVSREEAEDLVQETLAQVLKKPRFLHSDDDIGYLLRVLRNTFLSSRRFAQRRPESAFLVDELTSIEDLSAPLPEARLDCAELYRAIASLPDGFRDALIAIDLVGISYGEAASALHVREATIATRLHRGRQRVAEMLEADSGIAPTVRPTASARPSGI